MRKARPKGRADQTAVDSKGRSRISPSSGSKGPSSHDPPRATAWLAFSGKARWVSLVLIAANLIVYASVGHHDFVNYDDGDYVSENPIVARGLTWHGLSWAFTTGYASNWHPLTWLSHMLDVQLYGLNPGPHHLTNLLFHIANTLLLFGLFHRMTGALGRSALVAGIAASGAGTVVAAGSTFSLGEVLFNVASDATAGPASLVLDASGTSLSDASGNTIPISTLDNGQITITTSTVPEPSMFAPLALLFMIAAGVRRRERV
jgi:hypothetical protein